MFYVMSNKSDIIIVAAGDVRYHQRIGFKVESKHNNYDQAQSSSLALEWE